MTHTAAAPIVLFNDECGVCRSIAAWVEASARGAHAPIPIVVQAIGADPDALARLHPQLDIWEAYATIHVIMPDGSLKLGGEAVAEVLRDLPNTRWFAWVFAVSIGGRRPFQTVLNACYTILSEIRPLMGCESCGSTRNWAHKLKRSAAWTRRALGADRNPAARGYLAAATRRQP